MSHRLALMLFGLTIALRMGVANDQKPGPPASAQLVTGSVHMYAEVFAACSPDGRWLAFEYNEENDPDAPRIGVMALAQGAHLWHTLLERKPGRHLYAGDLSWSPDSRWLALISNYPEGTKSFWSDVSLQVVKVNIETGEVVRLTNFPPRTLLGPTTTWLRSGMIVFSAADENIYSVSEKGGEIRKLINAPTGKCDGPTNTLAASPDEQRIAFQKDSGDESQTTECNALWIGDTRTGLLQRVPTVGLKPLNPFWLDENTILFSGQKDNRPTGIFALSLNSQKVTRILDGPYMSPFVCNSGKTLYFSWGQRFQSKPPAEDVWPTIDDFNGFHIWKVPLRDVLR